MRGTRLCTQAGRAGRGAARGLRGARRGSGAVGAGAVPGGSGWRCAPGRRGRGAAGPGRLLLRVCGRGGPPAGLSAPTSRRSSAGRGEGALVNCEQLPWVRTPDRSGAPPAPHNGTTPASTVSWCVCHAHCALGTHTGFRGGGASPCANGSCCTQPPHGSFSGASQCWRPAFGKDLLGRKGWGRAGGGARSGQFPTPPLTSRGPSVGKGTCGGRPPTRPPAAHPPPPPGQPRALVGWERAVKSGRDSRPAAHRTGKGAFLHGKYLSAILKGEADIRSLLYTMVLLVFFFNSLSIKYFKLRTCYRCYEYLVE